MAGGEACQDGIVLGKQGVGECVFRSANQEKQLSCPEKDIEQSAALEVVQFLAAHGNLQSSARALFDEGAKHRQLEREAAGIFAPRVDALQILVAQFDEMIDAKILLRQGSDSEPVTKVHGTDFVRQHLRNGP